MNVDKYIKKQIIGYSTMTLMGIIALLIGFVFNYQTHTMSGIAFGFIPAGLGCLIILLYSRNKPNLRQNIVSECDERSVYVRNKSGATAFWITYWWIFALTMLTNIKILTVNEICIATLIFMGVIYFTIFFRNLARY